MNRVTVGGLTPARSANRATLSSPAIGYEASRTRASLRSAELRSARRPRTSSPTRTSSVVTFVTSGGISRRAGTFLTRMLSPVSFAAKSFWGGPHKGGEAHERSGSVVRRRDTPQARLRARVAPQDVDVLQLRSLFHDHLDSLRMSDRLLLRHDERWPGRHHAGLATCRDHGYPGRSRNGGG